ncbi:hypothetical protein GCM10007856_06540 [Azospirillum oryzae]|nr:hypothetical protein GCM10007856_06540 [Azospirillum oryzae]
MGGLFHAGTVAGDKSLFLRIGLSTENCTPPDSGTAHICNHASIVGWCERGGGLAATAAHNKGEKRMDKILTLLILLLPIIKACLDLLNR